MSRKIEPFEYIWAESGDTTPAPTDEKIQEGYAGNEQPAMERFNNLQNRVENKINDLAIGRSSTTYEGAVSAALMISTGQWIESWGSTADDLNIIDSGGGNDEYRDLAVFFDDDLNPRVMVAENNDTAIDVWDPRTNTLITTSNYLPDDLPAAGATWQIVSICTDGDTLYAVLTDTNAAPDTHIVQAWVIDEAGSDWSVKTGWPATGTALQGTGNGPNGAFRDAKVIIADDDHLAISCGWTTVSAAADPAIQLIDRSDGSAVRDGAGDCPQGDSANPCEGIASDGTNIFFATEGTANEYICSATIADLTAGCGGANYPLTTEDSSRMIACGPNLIVSAPYSATSAADVILRTHNATDADLDIITVGQSSAGTPLPGGQFTMELPTSLGFDGINLYILGTIDITAAGEGQQTAICKIDASKLSLVNVDKTRQICDLMPSTFIMAADQAPGAANRYYSIAYDSRDIWVTSEPEGGQTTSGRLYRLPLAFERG